MEEVNMANFVPPLSITSPSSPTRSERISKIISPSMAAVSPNTSFELKARLSLKSREVHLCVEKALSLLSKTHGETTDIEIKDPKTRYHNYYFKAHRECLSRAIASIQKVGRSREAFPGHSPYVADVFEEQGEVVCLIGPRFKPISGVQGQERGGVSEHRLAQRPKRRPAGRCHGDVNTEGSFLSEGFAGEPRDHLGGVLLSEGPRWASRVDAPEPSERGPLASRARDAPRGPERGSRGWASRWTHRGVPSGESPRWAPCGRTGRGPF
ncbi:hypothetical protein CYMTET_10939 [Cymbomonas tetramitiformis]|uniref:Uncharacterized protein n=1 Tax=Cymbomonas tetramitiformis TaxID=36881 RepID=A0AAE0GN53_9CHLO|nr:hypothetical protein CYMTET_10939 [Cymbomonas tetramitiformis]